LFVCVIFVVKTLHFAFWIPPTHDLDLAAWKRQQLPWTLLNPSLLDKGNSIEADYSVEPL
jgi:hypothetical protein